MSLFLVLFILHSVAISGMDSATLWQFTVLDYSREFRSKSGPTMRVRESLGIYVPNMYQKTKKCQKFAYSVTTICLSLSNCRGHHITTGIIIPLCCDHDLGRQITAQYRGIFRIFSAQIAVWCGQFLDEKGGPRSRNPRWYGIDFRGSRFKPDRST